MQTISELREPVTDGENIEFTDHGCSARTVKIHANGQPDSKCPILRHRVWSRVVMIPRSLVDAASPIDEEQERDEAPE
jgi:hypothetical protein